jgi:hypothetical protein
LQKSVCLFISVTYKKQTPVDKAPTKAKLDTLTEDLLVLSKVGYKQLTSSQLQLCAKLLLPAEFDFAALELHIPIKMVSITCSIVLYCIIFTLCLDSREVQRKGSQVF